MKERFTKLPAYFYEDGRIWFHDLYINLFQIEGFIEVDIEFTDETGENVVTNGTKIFTKSGMEYDIYMPLEEFVNITA
jgi:hypothetical protein